MTIQQAMEIAVLHHQAGRLREAELLYRQVLRENQNQPDALHLLGVIASQTGNHAWAIDLIGRAISLNRTMAEYHANLGVALSGLGRHEEAVAAYGQGLALRPDAEQTINNLGNALAALGRNAEAAACFNQASLLNPDYADPHYNLANLNKESGRIEEAVAGYRRALALRPNWEQAGNNLGNALCAMGRYDQARTLYEEVLAQRPDDPLAHWNMGLLLLRQGDLRRGLAEYEWRWQVKELGLSQRRIDKPLWDGAELNGRRILLYGEQGFGDTIQFIRYVPMVAARGGRVLVSCHKELSRLLAGFPGVERFVGSTPNLADFDVHCLLASLPAKLGTMLHTIPAEDPYLSADAELSAQWNRRLAEQSGLKVGIAWAGRPAHPHDRARSIPAAPLRPLVNVEGVCFVSLQKGDAAGQFNDACLRLMNWTDELGDFADTAGLVANLDLVVTVDTAVAHLAGAMGKRVWLMLPYVPDWRWMLDRTDSPWYPGMRLFRQKRLGDWEPVVAEVRIALEEMRERRGLRTED